MFKKLMVLAMIGMLFGCGKIDPNIYSANKPIIDPAVFFSGKTVAKGVLKNRAGEVTRSFVADIVGSLSKDEKGEDILTLNEEFRFNDGEVQHRTWVMTKTGDNTYNATAGDVIGTAKGKTAGNAFNLRYVLRVPVDGKTYDIDMDDWMYLVDDTTVINNTMMTKFGFKVGELMLVIEKA